jgi:density-regulated protein DRP1
MADEDAGAAAADQELPAPPPVLYCGVCTLPPELCEFDAKLLPQCRAWLAVNHPEAYKAITGEEPPAAAAAAEQLKVVSEAAAVAAEKKQSGKKKDETCVIVKRVERSKRKCVTVISGLDSVGVKLADAAKVMSKKFSCGASVVKGVVGGDEIDVQGDIVEDVIDLLMNHFKISESSIYTMDGGQKVPIK